MVNIIKEDLDIEEALKVFKKLINSILNNDFKPNIWHFIKKW